jgi:hypothetical protein
MSRRDTFNVYNTPLYAHSSHNGAGDKSGRLAFGVTCIDGLDRGVEGVVMLHGKVPARFADFSR